MPFVRGVCSCGHEICICNSCIANESCFFCEKPKKMTLITPEMQKKQEEAMDKFLARQVTKRYQQLRGYKRTSSWEKLKKLDPGNHPFSTRFRKVEHRGVSLDGKPIYSVEQVADWKAEPDYLSYYCCSHYYSTELAATAFVKTYIPLAKYHAMTYKEQEERDKVRLSTSFKREKINCWNSLENKYVEVDRICLSGPKEAPFVKRLTGSAGNYPNQILCDFWIPGFDYLESSGYYLAPEGWQPPPQWDVVDQREKKKD